MLDALKTGFEEPRTPQELIELLRSNRILKRIKSTIGTSDNADQLAQQNNFFDNRMLIGETAIHLQETLLKSLDAGDPGGLSKGFYLDLQSFIDICKELDEGDVAFGMIQKVADLHLNPFDNIKSRQFHPIHREIIENVMSVLDYFNVKMPQNPKANELQAEVEYLLAKFLEWQTKRRLGERLYTVDTIESLTAGVNHRYEDAMHSAKISVGFQKSGVIAVEDPGSLYFWETIATDYAKWLRYVGDIKAANILCQEVEFEIPTTKISEEIGFKDKKEDPILFGGELVEDLTHLSFETRQQVLEAIKSEYPGLIQPDLKN